jgi:glycosyltransferase involved in cell wall biosynthesis
VAAGAGTAFRTGDPAALAQRVVELAARPHDLREMGQRAREAYVAAYSPSRNLQALRAIYSDVVCAR